MEEQRALCGVLRELSLLPQVAGLAGAEMVQPLEMAGGTPVKILLTLSTASRSALVGAVALRADLAEMVPMLWGLVQAAEVKERRTAKTMAGHMAGAGPMVLPN